MRLELNGVTPLELPTDRPRPAPPDPGRDRVAFTVPASFAATARYATLLTAFATLLARHSGQWSVPVGTPGLGTPALLCELTGDPAFDEAVERVGRTLADSTTTPSGDLPCRVLFDLYEEEATAPATATGADTELAMRLRTEPDGSIAGVLEYTTALFDQDTVERMAERFLALLTAAAQRPETPLSALDLLPPAERDLLVRRWNDTAVPRSWRPVHELFADHVGSAPDAVALVDAGSPDGTHVTYRELDERAEWYARRLLVAGVQPESVVGVLADRNPELVAALLGVWKAGAAYLPLNPELPADRIHYMLEDSGASVVIAEAGHRRLLPEGFPGAVLELGTGPAPAVAAPPRPSTAGRLAYLMYTSGSTGRPKGVKIEHRSLVNLLLAMRDEVGAGGTWLAVTSTSFDISGLELYLPLVSGGRIVLAGTEQARDGQTLVKAIEAHEVSHVQATPSSWKLLLQAGFDFPSVVALAGGEALSLDLARRLRPRVRRLVNVYGPTETTIWSTLWEVPRDPDRVAIGRPLQNTTVYVLDERQALLPVGVPGELCIGGTGLARGYRNRPDETAARFVRNPFGPPGSRLYRTGDIVRTRPDGTLEYLDRADNQVKIRGHRIEPDEIAAVLRTHDGVADALVVAAAIGSEQHLVAYWIPADPDRRATDTELVGYCRLRLPAYMIPIRFLALDAFPLNLSGKVDRKALPAPDLMEPAADDAGAPPLAGPVAERLAALWSELFDGLPIHHAGHHFFELGGTSLLAARLTAGIREHFGLTVPLSTVFTHPTLARLAEAVEAGTKAEIDPLGVTDASGAVRLPPQPASYLSGEETPSTRYVCQLAWWIEGEVDRGALAAALADVQRRHEALGARYLVDEGLAVPAVEDREPEFHDLPDAGTEDEAVATLRATLFRPLDIANGRVWRTAVLRSGDTGRTLFGLTAHHAAFDGLSEEPFAADLSVAYRARLAGAAPVFPAPAPTLTELATAYQQGLALADLTSQRRFWKHEMDGLPELELPQHLPSMAASGPIAKAQAHVTAAELAPWDDHCRRRGSSRTGALVGVYGAALAGLTGQSDFGIMVPVAKRTVLGGITCRIDSVCVRLRSASGADWFDAAQDAVAGALAAQDVTFGDVARMAFMAGSGLSLLNLPMLLLHDEGLPVLTLPGCRSQVLRLDSPATATEIELAVKPGADDGLELTVSTRADRLPAGFGRRVLDEIVRMLRAAPGAAPRTSATATDQEIQEVTH
ncbi:amino acid adenylation domain-containing protein [Streptomyces griseochromogenes]|uniref:amino acid adenylation domain-containing protein n=1 Tax=Streptomyces griseochromogenes TaxID=68214 RepID=UPI0037B305CD